MKKSTVIKHPLYRGDIPLLFDNDSVSNLTDNEKCNVFMSKWMDTFDPVDEYKKNLPKDEKELSKVLKMVKNNYKKCVLENSWTERKYIMVVDSILSTPMDFNYTNIMKQGKLYDDERLELQLREKRSRSRRRI